MQTLIHYKHLLYSSLFMLAITSLTGCDTSLSQPPLTITPPVPAYYNNSGLPLYRGQAPYSAAFNDEKYAARMPIRIAPQSQKIIIVDPRLHAWGAYDSNGMRVGGGIATAGADYCPDEGRACRTSVGTFRIYSLGNADCVSRSYPIGEGGALMPYCMFFHQGQSLHGSPDQIMSDANISHGCVHMRIPDVAWLRYHFAQIGTKVVIMPY